ncbi:MAG: MFS transporter, partial [Chthoniobacterales bacterium]
MSDTAIKYPPGFRPRRGLNWFIIGLLYASFYTCRYNFRWATPGMVEEFGFSKFQITSMLSAWALAYGTGQLINGLLTDRIGGKKAMLIGAVGTICINLIYGFASFISTFATFSLIWLINGYVQSFGAPGMIKMNAAWFHRTERGTFAGIFGFMIQLGQFAINNLAPVILAGFTVGDAGRGAGRLALAFPHPAAHHGRSGDPPRHFRQANSRGSRSPQCDRARRRNRGRSGHDQH